MADNHIGFLEMLILVYRMTLWPDVKPAVVSSDQSNPNTDAI